jgi:hypothetical protein
MSASAGSGHAYGIHWFGQALCGFAPGRYAVQGAPRLSPGPTQRESHERYFGGAWPPAPWAAQMPSPDVPCGRGLPCCGGARGLAADPGRRCALGCPAAANVPAAADDGGRAVK